MKKRHARRKRRLANMRLRTGKKIVRHRLRGGRTGSVHHKNQRAKRKSFREIFKIMETALADLPPKEQDRRLARMEKRLGLC